MSASFLAKMKAEAAAKRARDAMEEICPVDPDLVEPEPKVAHVDAWLQHVVAECVADPVLDVAIEDLAETNHEDDLVDQAMEIMEALVQMHYHWAGVVNGPLDGFLQYQKDLGFDECVPSFNMVRDMMAVCVANAHTEGGVWLKAHGELEKFVQSREAILNESKIDTIVMNVERQVHHLQEVPKLLAQLRAELCVLTGNAPDCSMEPGKMMEAHLMRLTSSSEKFEEFRKALEQLQESTAQARTAQYFTDRAENAQRIWDGLKDNTKLVFVRSNFCGFALVTRRDPKDKEYVHIKQTGHNSAKKGAPLPEGYMMLCGDTCTWEPLTTIAQLPPRGTLTCRSDGLPRLLIPLDKDNATVLARPFSESTMTHIDCAATGQVFVVDKFWLSK